MSTSPKRGQSAHHVHAYNRCLIVTNIIGFCLSAYAYHVGISKKAEPNYQALCDISETMSCSRVVTSPYSTGFGFMEQLVGESSILNQSNSVTGMLAYFLLLVLSFSNGKFFSKLHFLLAILSNIGSIYLAGILVILENFCVICISTYTMNALNLLLVYKKLEVLQQKQVLSAKKKK